MDDVWGNAWSQPDNEEDLAHSVHPTKHSTTQSWTLPEVAAEETDVGTPSWGSGGVNWAEPIGQTSLWASSTTDSISLETGGWATDPGFKLDSGSTYAEVESTQSPTSSVNEIKEEREESAEKSEPEGYSRSSTPTSTGTVTIPVTDVKTPSASEFSTNDDPSVSDNAEAQDPFGSFETGFSAAPTSSFDDDGTNAWVSAVPELDGSTVEADAWEPNWDTTHEADENEETPKDEWVIAKEEKARRDRMVPPQLMKSIIEELDKLSSDIWPDKDCPKYEKYGNWRGGMGNVEGLEELVRKTIPETPFQPPLSFSGSNIAKSMTKSLKLTKNLPIVRNSPMSHLFLAKNLAAWELSIKNTVVTSKDDIPPGWRTIEPIAEEQTSKAAAVEKKLGGFLSFLGRRSTGTPPQPSTPVRSETRRSSLSSNSKEASPVVANNTTGPDTTISHLSGTSANQIANSSSISSLSSVLPPSPSNSTFSAKSSSISSFSGTAQTNSQERPTTETAPSVVSRFFNRFSRTKSESSSSPRNSIALSTDEIDFLSDIVPSHSDDTDHDAQLDALTALVSSPPVATKLPPPLAPPPLVPPPRPPSTNRMPAIQPQRSLSPTSISVSSSSTGQTRTALPIMSSILSKESSVLPPPLPPPLMPSVLTSSKPSTPSPEVGNNVEHITRPSSSASNIISPGFSGASRVLESLSGDARSLNSTQLTNTSPLSPLSVQVSNVTTEASLTTTPSDSSKPIPSFSQLTNDFSLSPTGSIPPPPIEKSPNRIYAHTKGTPKSFIDDEFSDFQRQDSFSSPDGAFAQDFLQATSSSANTNFDDLTNKNIFTQSSPQNVDSFGDFGDFMSTPPTTSASPNPLQRVPSPMSPPPIGVLPPLPQKQVPVPIKTGKNEHIRKPSSADHEATAQLVQRAAAHQGRWPAPLTPVPEPLSPPPLPPSTNTKSGVKKSLFELDDDEPLANGLTSTQIKAPAPKQSITLKPIAQLNSSTVSAVMSDSNSANRSPPLARLKLAPPPGSRPGSRIGTQPEPELVVSLLDIGGNDNASLLGNQPSVPVKTVQPNLGPVAGTGLSKSGGLSAQDLSFFEGL